MINYRSIQNLNRVIQDNLHLIPQGIEVIAGVHRSGQLAAQLLATQLNLPVISLRNLCETDWVYTGFRGFIEPEDQEIYLQTPRKVLVVEDASTSGVTMIKEKGRVSASEKALRHEITYLSVYPASDDVAGVDIFFEVLPGPRLFEWNWLNHGMMSRGCVSLENLMCRQTTDAEEVDDTQFRRHVKTTPSLVRPQRRMNNIVSTRLTKFAAATRGWLENKGIQCATLHTMPCASTAERRNWGTGKYKAGVYMNIEEAKVFFEGDPADARAIFDITHRPVYCVKTKTLYQ